MYIGKFNVWDHDRILIWTNRLIIFDINHFIHMLQELEQFN